jgi:hypothetical protein
MCMYMYINCKAPYIAAESEKGCYLPMNTCRFSRCLSTSSSVDFRDGSSAKLVNTCVYTEPCISTKSIYSNLRYISISLPPLTGVPILSTLKNSIPKTNLRLEAWEPYGWNIATGELRSSDWLNGPFISHMFSNTDTSSENFLRPFLKFRKH